MSAETLAETQRRFYALAVKGAEGVAEIDDVFVGTPGLPAAARMQVYGNMYWIRLFDTLAEQFPELYTAVGRADFGKLARGYLEAHPPTSPSLRELGCHLPAHLADRPELAAIAELEWTRIDLFDGPDVETLTADDLQALDPEALAERPLALSPTARVLRGALLVHRSGHGVDDRALEPEEAAALAEVARGTTIGLLCDSVGDASIVFGFLSRWLDGEILRR